MSKVTTIKLHEVRPTPVPSPHGYGPSSGVISCVRTIRYLTGGSLKYAKKDVFDSVYNGTPVTIQVQPGVSNTALDELEAVGFIAEVISGMVNVSVSIPTEHQETLRRLVMALDGEVHA